ncbi:STAS domain-containing protein [Streptacidiphilus albus]|uniref:STAS domain-containing protein n=1 Tax=Streptacidiphilus albus TaxID=105425 RepID=UPI000689E66B|nr:STAS domain-containing protein [Streptacidiphilus albus]
MESTVNTRVHEEKCRIVRPRGELDLANASAFGGSLGGLEAPGGVGAAGGPEPRLVGVEPPWDVPRVVVDLTEVTFMDLSPLRELRVALVRAEQHGGWVRLVHNHPGIDRLLHATRLAEVFPRYASLAAARAGEASRHRL